MSSPDFPTANYSLDDLTVLVLTYNEEANIGRTLESLAWARKILVVDSCSTDRTQEIVRRLPQARVVERAFTHFTEQWNFGLGLVETEWTLAIDSDYVFPAGAAKSIEEAMNSGPDSWRGPFEYCVYGQPVRGSILPSREVLFLTGKAHFVDDGHTQKVKVSGSKQALPFRIRHDDRKPLSRWCAAQIRYAREEADKLATSDPASLCFNDRIRRLVVFAPFLVFLLVYVFRGGFLSGWRGLYYAMQRFVAECLLSLFLIDQKLRKVAPGSGGAAS